MNATLEQIVNDPNLWETHVDPEGAEPESFDTMTLAQRITAVRQMFPADMTAEDMAYAEANS
jgi:hypothetical protein